MSDTYSLACPSKNIKIWVGQRDYLYKSHIPVLARFLHETMGEPLVFVRDGSNDEADDCEDFEGILAYEG